MTSKVLLMLLGNIESIRRLDLSERHRDIRSRVANSTACCSAGPQGSQYNRAPHDSLRDLIADYSVFDVHQFIVTHILQIVKQRLDILPK
jgi:hypothetical protein